MKTQHVAVDPKPYEPPTMVKMTKAQAGQLSVGDKVSITISGEVQGIRKHFDTASYEVEIKDSKVSGIEGNSADKAMKEMRGA